MFDNAAFAAAARTQAARAYERSRMRAALMWTLPMVALAAASCGLGTQPQTACLVGLGLFALGFVFLWRGKSLGRAVAPGVFAGLVPLTLALLARTMGHVCAGGACVSLCIPACTAGGACAGILIAHASRFTTGWPRALFVGGSGAVALLVGSLGCSCVGYGGIAGLAIGMGLAALPLAFALRPAAL